MLFAPTSTAIASAASEAFRSGATTSSGPPEQMAAKGVEARQAGDPGVLGHVRDLQGSGRQPVRARMEDDPGGFAAIAVARGAPAPRSAPARVHGELDQPYELLELLQVDPVPAPMISRASDSPSSSVCDAPIELLFVRIWRSTSPTRGPACTPSARMCRPLTIGSGAWCWTPRPRARSRNQRIPEQSNVAGATEAIRLRDPGEELRSRAFCGEPAECAVANRRSAD